MRGDDEEYDSEKGRDMHVMDTRFADVKPQSFNKGERTVDAVLSMGSEVKRFYGREALQISPKACDLSRMESGGVPVLDHHKQDGIDSMLGRVTETWFRNKALMGRLKFNETPRGEMALGMVSRGEVAGVSIGYAVDEWRITDKEGNVIDPQKDRMRWDDDLLFTGTRWKLFEASLVGVPADSVATVRSFGSGMDRHLPDVDELAERAVSITKRFGDLSVTYDLRRATSPIDDIRARMASRQAMSDRMFK